MTQADAIKKAIDACGSQKALANLLGKSQGHVATWQIRGRAPAGLCIAIEQATNGAVTRYELRPDVFGPAEQAA